MRGARVVDQGFDVVVIGAGPAGEVTAGRCSEGGLETAIVEVELVGGECSYWACIPSKTLLRPGEILAETAAVPGAAEKADDKPDATAELQRDYFGMHRFEWPDDDTVEFHLGYGSMIRLLRANGFEIEDLIEIRPPEGATTSYKFVNLEWARRWPSEEVWKARKTGR
jgi:phytoene dehydrogenase-like protein